jgi:hypothetical protein
MHPSNLVFLNIGNKILEPFLEYYKDWWQVFSLTLYLCHWTWYSNFLRMILESRIYETSNSSYSSISTGGGGTWNLPGIDDSLYGSSKEMWNTGWIFIKGGNFRWNATSLICLITGKTTEVKFITWTIGIETTSK